MTVIDAHHHFWDPDNGHFPWMTDDIADLRRVFDPSHLRPLLADHGVDATVLVQTQHRIEETKEYLQIAHDTDFVAGVVGWVDLTASNLSEMVADLLIRADGKYLVGIRHQVHDEEDENWLGRADVHAGLQVLQHHNLAYDLLLRQRELRSAIGMVSAFPDMRLVVDHIAKPDIANEAWQPWADEIRILSQADNVHCKLSGMITEANWTSWSPDDLRPYIDHVLDNFGPRRCFFGSDWPVCTLAGSYGRVKSALEECLSGVSPAEKAAIFGGNAAAFYRLPDFSSASSSLL